MTRHLTCSYCGRFEVLGSGTQATIPFYNELEDGIDFEDACSECTRLARAFLLKRKKGLEESIR